VNNLEDDNIGRNQVFAERLGKERCEALTSGIRYLLILACFIYPSFYGLDLITTREYHLTFLGFRLFVVFNYLLGIALLSTSLGSKIAGPLSIWEVYITNLAISIMTTYIGGFDSSYYIGIIFVIFVSGLFLPLDISGTIVNGLLTLVSYFVINTFFSPPESVKLAKAIPPFFFMSGAVAFTVFATISRERNRRNNLQLRMQIEKANEELKELDQAKTRFFSNVSHELRSPLTLILGPLETLLGGEQNPQIIRPLLQAMEANARRLLRQVNTLLDFAKMNVGKLECKYEYGNLSRIIQGLANAAGPHLQNRKINLVMEGFENIPDTLLDPFKVETMAANLLSNAIKFTPEGGRITIRIGEENEIVWFEVEDTGIGIPEDKLNIIFDEFIQVDDKMNRSQEGTGLGLAMVKQLAKLQAGRVTVRSKLGEGATFRIELPKNPDSNVLERRRNIGRRREDEISYARTLAMINTSSPERSESQKETLLADVLGARFGEKKDFAETIRQRAPLNAQKVLVVEDNPDLRFFIASNLADDYQVEMAEDGLEGLEMARRWLPDLIVSDIMMPRMDGHELTRRIREDPSLSQMPVILATAKSGGEAVVEGLGMGANDYLAKPFEIRELKARVSAQLRTHRLERNLSERESRLAAIGQTTSAIVHDLKTPLNSIIGFAEVARQDVLSGKEADEVIQDLEPVISEANRLDRMIGEVLDFARGSSSDLNLVPTELDVYLQTVCLPLEQRLAAIGIELIIKHESDSNLLVLIDNDRMLRVIENLIRNAQEAIWSSNQNPQGKHIWITTSSDQRSVTVRVTDDGPGLPEEMVKNLFEAFVSGKKSTGTGLGLATVRNLVIAHGGEITAEPGGPEGGAAFVMKFPRVTSSLQ
jgi:signal transduction histidine kinase